MQNPASKTKLPREETKLGRTEIIEAKEGKGQEERIQVKDEMRQISKGT
jgi:hypothetical protein